MLSLLWPWCRQRLQQRTEKSSSSEPFSRRYCRWRVLFAPTGRAISATIPHVSSTRRGRTIFCRRRLETISGTPGAGTSQKSDDATFLAAREAAVSGAEYINQNCVSGLPSQAVVGGLAVLANASDFVFKDQEVGLFSMGSLVGFRNENLKLKVSRHSVKLKFQLDF